jgi:hypothetical protein
LGLFALLSLSVSPVLANPDTYIKEKTHTDAITMLGMTVSPAQDTYEEIWVSGNKMRMDSYDEKGNLTDSTIWRGDRTKMYFIDYANKTYGEMDLSTDVSGVASMMEMTVKVTPTSESKKIKNWNCKKYVMKIETSIAGITSTTIYEIWASEDVHIDYGRYMELSQSAISGLLSFTEDIAKELEKVKGYPVLSITTITTMGQSIKSTTELLEYDSHRSVSKGFYNVPKGYTKVEASPGEEGAMTGEEMAEAMAAAEEAMAMLEEEMGPLGELAGMLEGMGEKDGELGELLGGLSGLFGGRDEEEVDEEGGLLGALESLFG